MIDTAKRARLAHTLRIAPGPVADAIAAKRPAAERAALGLWRRDASVWSADAETQQKVANRLGWLTSPQLMMASVDRLQKFADAVKADGITDVVLLGMGGSSLAPEVMRAVLGGAPGWPRFHMLDSTDPAAVRAVATPPATSLYLLASKSGSTIEPNVLAAHFRETLVRAGVTDWSRHFVAITDDNTQLSKRAHDERFRDVFINPADIGGRYSAVSFFGMVPAALMGVDIAGLVGWALAMIDAADPGNGSPAENPAVALGLAMGAAARAGRDKLTLVLPPSLDAFGLWVEQLIAESTGKHGVGIVPIAGEPVGDASVYGADRFFVRVNVAGSAQAAPAGSLGPAPIAEIEMPEVSALGAEFVRWEIATAIAGAILEINPFDEPNVQQAKDATKKLLEGFKATKQLPVPAADATLDGVTLTLSRAAKPLLGGPGPMGLLSLLQPSDYVAILAYVGPDRVLAQELAEFRRGVRDRTHAATMFGYGPRYLHSTGQLHKGGPNTGVFVLISAAPAVDVPIPGEPFSFGTLELAQALGDFASLDATGRRALHIHLPSPDATQLRRVAGALLDAR